MAEMVEMALEGVIQLPGGGHVAVLRELGGERSVGIGLGAHPAHWLSAQLARVPLARPNTYVLALRVIDCLGGHLLRATLDDNGQTEPAAYVELEGPGGVVELGCSPQDAVALAAYGGVPILVQPTLFNSGARRAGTHLQPRRREGPRPPAPDGEPGAPPAPPQA